MKNPMKGILPALVACCSALLLRADTTNETNAPYIFNTAPNQPFEVMRFQKNGEEIFTCSLKTNVVNSRLVDLPQVLCTITNLMLVVKTKTDTNEIVVQRLGVWCEEVPIPERPSGIWGIDRMATNVLLLPFTPSITK